MISTPRFRAACICAAGLAVYAHAQTETPDATDMAGDFPASLQFTDKAGKALPDGMHYDPSAGAAYLRYKDDWVEGTISAKTVYLAVTNNGGKSPADAESLTIAMVVGKRMGAAGIWEGEIAVANGPWARKYDDTLQAYVAASITARVMSHNEAGAAGPVIADTLLVAPPDREAVLTLLDERGKGVSPGDSAIRLTIRDQDLSAARDTLYANLSCAESKDVIVNLMLVESLPGTYASAAIPMVRGTAATDGILQCHGTDLLSATYRDPVFGMQNTVTVTVTAEAPVSLRRKRPSLRRVAPAYSGYDAGGRKIRALSKVP